MDCQQLLNLTGWRCSPAGIRTVRAIAPLTIGGDGQHAAFYIASTSEESFFLTDACETAMHAERFGVVLNKSKFDMLNKTYGVKYARFDNDGSIVAEGDFETMQFALWDAVKLAMSLSFKTNAWQPKFEQSRFQTIVINEFSEQLGLDRIITSAKVQGISGHVIEFPLGVKRQNGTVCFVQPIALLNGGIDWSGVYQAHGKLFDVKAVSEINNRLAIIEEGALLEDFGRAATLLTLAAPVKTLSGTRNWLEYFG